MNGRWFIKMPTETLVSFATMHFSFTDATNTEREQERRTVTNIYIEKKRRKEKIFVVVVEFVLLKFILCDEMIMYCKEALYFEQINARI